MQKNKIMKGTLYKKIMPSGWFVAFTTGDFNFHRTELPLHPDDESLWMFAELNEEWKDKLDGKEVEFEIVEQCCTPEGQIKRYVDCKGCDKKQNYAKLIPSKEQQKQLITEIMDLDAKDGLYEDDVEKLADNHVESLGFITFKNDYSNERRTSFIDGYNKAKETLYTEEQVKEIVEKSRETGLTAEYLMLSLKQPKKD
jgi:hypothetical protein